jgi:hypothetical protein
MAATMIATTRMSMSQLLWRASQSWTPAASDPIANIAKNPKGL